MNLSLLPLTALTLYCLSFSSFRIVWPDKELVSLCRLSFFVVHFNIFISYSRFASSVAFEFDFTQLRFPHLIFFLRFSFAFIRLSCPFFSCWLSYVMTHFDVSNFRLVRISSWKKETKWRRTLTIDNHSGNLSFQIVCKLKRQTNKEKKQKNLKKERILKWYKNDINHRF